MTPRNLRTMPRRGWVSHIPYLPVVDPSICTFCTCARLYEHVQAKVAGRRGDSVLSRHPRATVLCLAVQSHCLRLISCYIVSGYTVEDFRRVLSSSHIGQGICESKRPAKFAEYRCDFRSEKHRENAWVPSTVWSRS